MPEIPDTGDRLYTIMAPPNLLHESRAMPFYL